jgi:hypothetical protein
MNDDQKTTPPEDKRPEPPPLRYFHMRGEYDRPPAPPPEPVPWWTALWQRVLRAIRL